jgi:hypothetical protein
MLKMFPANVVDLNERTIFLCAHVLNNEPFQRKSQVHSELRIKQDLYFNDMTQN